MKYLVEFKAVAEVEAQSAQEAEEFVRRQSVPVSISEPEIVESRRADGAGEWDNDETY